MNRKYQKILIFSLVLLGVGFALLIVFLKAPRSSYVYKGSVAKENAIFIKNAVDRGYIQNEAAIISCCSCDLNHDGNEEIVLLLKASDGGYGDELLILTTIEGIGVKKTYSASFKNLQPWKVQSCDVEGDGEIELSLGVFTKAKFHPVYAKRPFLYNFKKNDLYPKWLGSRLSRPFDDYVFTDMDDDKMDELIAIETCQDEKKELTIYKWKGFGFESLGTSNAYDDIADLKPSHNRITAKIKNGFFWGKKTFQFEPDQEKILETSR